MSLKKEIKENKWGIVLGGIWGFVSLWIVLFSGIDLPHTPWIYVFLLPGRLSVYYLLGSSINFLICFAISPVTGMTIGYIISKLVKVIK